MLENQTLLLVIIVLIIVVVVGFIVAGILMDNSDSEPEAGTVELAPSVVELDSVPLAAVTEVVAVT
jgi:hypothetical protein